MIRRPTQVPLMPRSARPVLASSWFVAFPEGVLKAAWLIALAAMLTVLVCAFREARATGSSVLGSIGPSFKVLGQFVVAFF